MFGEGTSPQRPGASAVEMSRPSSEMLHLLPSSFLASVPHSIDAEEDDHGLLEEMRSVLAKPQLQRTEVPASSKRALDMQLSPTPEPLDLEVCACIASCIPEASKPQTLLLHG